MQIFFLQGLLYTQHTGRRTNMNDIIESLEKAYHNFCIRQKYFYGSIPSEFIGINLNNNLSLPYSFKRYYSITQNISNMNIFIKTLNERNMIHAINSIDDTSHHNSIIYEIALAHRTNENMNWLFSKLKQLLPYNININMEYIKKSLSNITITNDNNYKNAAIFFIGFVEKKISPHMSTIDTFKLYYLLRYCSSPDNIGKNFKIDNNLFFNKLKNSEITSFIKLISLIKPFIYNSKCDLWLAAIDFLSNNNMKYKIYVKGYDITIYDYLAKKFVELGEFYLSKQIVGYKEWISRHQELEQYGLAVCVDSNSLFTVNLYH